MGLLDMITGQKPKPGQPSGLLGMLGMDPNSTTFNVGAQLLANGLPTTQPFQMGAGIPQAIERSQTMQIRQQAVEQERADREAEAAQRKALADAVMPMMPENLRALAQADPKSALAILDQTRPEAVKPVVINDQLVNPMTGEIIGNYGDPNANVPPAPSGFRWAPDGSLTFIPGGPQDPVTKAGAKVPTEAELRAAGLNTVVSGDAALLLGDGSAENPGIYDQLANGGDQAWNMGGFGINPLSAMSSPEYRQAKDAVASIAQSYLYSTSGASAPEGEAARIADSVTPKPFDSPEQLQNKKDRLERMVLSIQQKQGNATPSGQGSAPAAGALPDLSSMSDEELMQQLGM